MRLGVCRKMKLSLTAMPEAKKCPGGAQPAPWKSGGGASSVEADGGGEWEGDGGSVSEVSRPETRPARPSRAPSSAYGAAPVGRGGRHYEFLEKHETCFIRVLSSCILRISRRFSRLVLLNDFPGKLLKLSRS